MDKKEYKITKDQCQSMIGERICSQCGGPLSPIETMDNSGAPTFWSGCQDCLKFDSGVSPTIYKIAKMMVINRAFIAYKHLRKPQGRNTDFKEHWLRTQIGGACDVVYDVLWCQKELRRIS